MKAFHLDAFRDYLTLEAGSSANTVENYLRDLRRLAQWGELRGITGPDAVTTTQLREFIYALKDLGLQPTTIRRQISALRTYFKFLTGEGIAVRDPTERLDAPKGWRRLPAVLSVQEVERLVTAPDADTPLGVRDRALLELCYATGARVSELVGLRLADLLFEEGLARLFGKGSKQRLVPVGRRALGGGVPLRARNPSQPGPRPLQRRTVRQCTRRTAVARRRVGHHQGRGAARRPHQTRHATHAAA